LRYGLIGWDAYVPETVDNAGRLLSLPRLDDDLARLEVTLRRAVSSEDPFLAEVATHLIAAGGKRLRPTLTIASAAAARGVAAGQAEQAYRCDQDILDGGVAVELVHLGSLYHDDVIDDAATRRGVETVNARWGNLVAIVAGDFLLARASEISARLGAEVAALMAATIGRLCEGQVLELKAAYDTTRAEDAYFASIAGKTAALMATSCRIGAMVAGLPPLQVEALTGFGQAFGMVFQIRDDVLDVVATDAELGKPAGQDLVEGIYTLPVIRALADPGVGDPLRDLLGRHLGPDERDRARDLVRTTGAVAAALGEARRFADEAASSLEPLDPSPVVEGMAALAHQLLDPLTARVA
jgi:heptaprenyl diphosphate synthase